MVDQQRLDVLVKRRSRGQQPCEVYESEKSANYICPLINNLLFRSRAISHFTSLL